jgi:hypothetical protein
MLRVVALACLLAVAAGAAPKQPCSPGQRKELVALGLTTAEVDEACRQGSTDSLDAKVSSGAAVSAAKAVDPTGKVMKNPCNPQLRKMLKASGMSEKKVDEACREGDAAMLRHNVAAKKALAGKEEPSDAEMIAPGHKWKTHGPVAGSRVGCNCSHYECQNIVSNWRSGDFKDNKWSRMCESQECCGCENCIERPAFPSKPATMTECYMCKDCSHCQYCDKCMDMPDTPELLCGILKVLPGTGMIAQGDSGQVEKECATNGEKAVHNLNWGHRRGVSGYNYHALDVGVGFVRPVMLTGLWTNQPSLPYEVFVSPDGRDWTSVGEFTGNATFNPPINKAQGAHYRGIYFARLYWSKTPSGGSNNWVAGIWAQFTGKRCPGHLCDEEGGPGESF